MPLRRYFYCVICFLLLFSGTTYSSNLNISDSLSFLTGGGYNDQNDGAAIIGFRYSINLDYQDADRGQLIWNPNVFSPPQVLDSINSDFILYDRGELYYEAFSSIEWTIGYKNYVWSINEVNKLTDFFNSAATNPVESFVSINTLPLSFKVATYFSDLYVESIVNKSPEPNDIPDREGFFDTSILQAINDQNISYVDGKEGNLNVGIKFSYPLSNWDSSLYLYEGLTQKPIYNIERNEIDPLVFDNIEHAFSNKKILGLSFLGSAFGATIKTEVINVIDDYREDIFDEGNYYQGVLGLEKIAINSDATTTFIVEYLKDTRKVVLPFESFMRENVSAAINSSFSKKPISIVLAYQDGIGSSSYFTTFGITVGKNSSLNIVYFYGRVEEEYFLSEGQLSGLIINWGKT